MYVLITIESLYYGELMLTFATHAEAFHAGCRLAGWWDIERII